MEFIAGQKVRSLKGFGLFEVISCNCNNITIKSDFSSEVFNVNKLDLIIFKNKS